jgi:hypothetical protein
METTGNQDPSPDDAEAQDADTPMVQNSRSQRATNPYDRQPSYRDIPLSKVTDDLNRMGINTFQLLHLLNTSRV